MTTRRIFLAAAGAAGAALAMPALLRAQSRDLAVEEIAGGLRHPWGVERLPGGEFLVTERPGRLRLVRPDGRLGAPIEGLPEIDAGGQGGLLDVALHPRFAETRRVFFTFTEPGAEGNSTACARGILDQAGTRLEDMRVIFSQKPKLPGDKHFGSRIVFDRQGHVFIGLGERSEEEYRGQAQDLGSHLGKVVRLTEEGEVPADNPFVGRAGALPEIWSYGHRNIQAAALHPETGELWAIEHGPMGGDELNIAEPGKNYGWPLVSFGVNYDGSPVGNGAQRGDGLTDPLYQWTPVIAPSGMCFYGGTLFPEWRGSILVGGLRARALVRLALEGRKVVAEERYLEDRGWRIRDVIEGPEGELYVLTDARDGKLLRLRPA